MKTCRLIAVLLPLLRRYALARHNERSSHVTPTPQGGGVAVIVATFVGVWAWATVIVASTLLLHQHHVLDVATGWPLGLAGGWGYRRLTGQRRTASPATHRGQSA